MAAKTFCLNEEFKLSEGTGNVHVKEHVLTVGNEFPSKEISIFFPNPYGGIRSVPVRNGSKYFSLISCRLTN